MKKSLALLLCLHLLVASLSGQNIYYSETITFKYAGMTILGHIGNNIHILFDQNSGMFSNKSITICIFSKKMELLKTQEIPGIPGTRNNYPYYFEEKNNGYELGVMGQKLLEDVNKIQIFEIDEEGNVTGSRQFDPTDQNRIQRFLIKPPERKGEYYTSLQPFIPDTAYDRELREAGELEKVKEDLFVYKVYDSLGMPYALQTRFPSGNFHFGNRFIVKDSQTDNIWVIASERLVMDAKNYDFSKQPSLFLAKLDLRLNSLLDGNRFLRINTPEKDNKIFYVVSTAHAKDDNLYLISRGYHNYTYYRKVGRKYSSEFEGFEILGLRFLQLDGLGNPLLDSTFHTETGEYTLDVRNSIYLASANGDDFICMQEFSHKEFGIRHFEIKNKSVKAHDVPVDSHNQYKFTISKRIGDREFIIPFMRNGKWGFMLYQL